MSERKTFILTMDLTPRFMSGYALRKHISEYRWRRIIKKSLAEKRGLVCEICGFSAKIPDLIDGHEAFAYLDDGTVRMVPIQLLCKRCHAIKDFAHTERLISHGVGLNRQMLIDHFCEKNQCTLADFNEHYDEARRRVHEIEKRYGPIIAHERVHYGDYQDHYLKAKDPARLNKWTAAQKAIADAICSSGVHEDYREDLLEIARNDELFAEELMQFAKGSNYKATRSLIAETLAEYFDDDSIITDDEPICWFIERGSP